MEEFTIALAGNANVGKSAIFNQLTGMSQIIGNWPGKTIEKAEGTLHFKGSRIHVLDLPGIYSLSTFSMEELISREYIALKKPEVVINIVDATALERNLFFTLQLIEMEAPIVIALNQYDLAKKRGISIDLGRLEELLGIPVVPTVAIRGIGIENLLEKCLQLVKIKGKRKGIRIEYGKEVESRIAKLLPLIEGKEFDFPPRWIAIKLLEGDEEVVKIVSRKSQVLVKTSSNLAHELETIHGEPCFTIIASERYNLANKIAKEVQVFGEAKPTMGEKIDEVTTHKVYGYPIMIASLASLLLWTFLVGNYLSNYISNILSGLEPPQPKVSGPAIEILWNGAFGGLVAGITLVIPYVLPFYLFLAIIEDSGYLTRVAFLMDNAMHKMGLHGKAIIPLILGYGCNVPACFSCRIMETHRERFIAAFVITLVPCAARTIVILGLVAAFVDIKWALFLYLLDLVFIFAIGRLAFKILPGESTGLIMEMPPYRVPSLPVVIKQTWARTKSLIYLVFPIYIVGSSLLQILHSSSLIQPLADAISPLTVNWLGLPALVGVLLIFGIVRKELTIVMLGTLFGTLNFASVLTPVQMLVLALVTMLYIPCASTILALGKEFGWKKAMYVTLFEIVFAILIGGIASRLFVLVL